MDKKISDLQENLPIDGTENIVNQKGTDNFKNTYTQLKDWILTFVSGGVQSVVAGSNVEVNNIDPENPIISAFPTTTAGVLSRTYFTGDTETLAAGTFYKSNREGKGTVSTVTQTVTVNDNEKDFLRDYYLL